MTAKYWIVQNGTGPKKLLSEHNMFYIDNELKLSQLFVYYVKKEHKSEAANIEWEQQN